MIFEGLGYHCFSFEFCGIGFFDFHQRDEENITVLFLDLFYFGFAIMSVEYLFNNSLTMFAY